MSDTPHEQVRRALGILAAGLRGYVGPDVQRIYGDHYQQVRGRSLPAGRPPDHWDAQALLTVMTDNWSLFKDKLGHRGRALVSELRDDRNRWAHQEPFSAEDAYRTADSVSRLLRLVGAAEAEDAESLRASLLPTQRPPAVHRVPASTPVSDTPHISSPLSRQIGTWFTRFHGETGHNQPGTPLFIPGEPPDFPDRYFNYTRLCLEEGFARIGAPAAGDLHDPGWRQRAQHAYPGITPRSLGYLEQFAQIRVGDIIVTPAFREKHDVHLGVVIPPRRTNLHRPPRRADVSAYYHHYDIAARD